MGSSIQGEIGEEMGKSCELNLNGDVVAFGSNLRSNIVGKVKIYSFNGTSWTQLGDTLLQLASNDGFGSNIALSYNAQTLVVGSQFSNQSLSLTNNGNFRTFMYNKILKFGMK
jgi:hypothetical protein